ncbi:glycoside hydrolase family 76 protein [Chitinophaga ginsengisoli]|uniref:Putative secreted protein (Por secretion system target) n=1 Tax=Chitinophaga ginsengisoli TaxID=363837 RepID=A0A2P8FS55_9BACT|nr:glycoside hydrolase family 76 protein [Chitinophaga ginsengisoli]PSL24546.1 putative secreted protein (Por secretion system target) [Chitinophaga ginsengisoli]
MKTLLQVAVLVLCLQFNSAGQLANFNATAEALQTSMYNNFGVPNENYWWCANGVDALLDGYVRTRSETYKTRMKSLLLGVKSFNGNTYINYFYDDMDWMGIATLRAYYETGDVDYYNVASALWTDIKGGYSNGAIDWNKGCAGCKNSCANAPAIILGARMYRHTNSAADLQLIKNIYTFMKANLVDPVTGAVWDNINLNTGVTNKDWIFSYNVGTFIGAGWELYKITGDVNYLNDAVKTAEYAMNSRRTNGMFFANETGGGDGGLFKGIFIRYLAQLAREGNIPAETRARYNEAIRFNAQTLKTSGINPSTNLVGTVWSQQPSGSTDYATQLSGVKVIEAAAMLDQSYFYKDINYGGSYWGLTVGSYNTDALVAKGILNNDITAFAIPAGYQVRLFKNDNYQGESWTVSGNSSWIGGAWNDSVSSLIVNYTAGASFFKDCNYTGDVISLEAGDYTVTQLQARGISNDAISSLKVSSGYQVILYEHDNFAGTSVTTSTDLNCLVSQNFNDLTSSLRIIATGAAPSAVTTAQTAQASKYMLKGLTLYPNPVANTLYVKGPDDLSGADVTVTDMMGRMKIRNRLSGNSVNVSGLPSGVYWITIVKSGKKITLSFVK